MPQIFDITVTLTEGLPVWPGDPGPTFAKVLDLDKGDEVNVTQINMCAHTGTHVDAPSHFLRGANGVEKLSLDVLIGPAIVIEVLDAPLITAEILKAANIPEGTKRLLIKTSNSERWIHESSTFEKEYVAISKEGADYLVERNIELVGVDYLSVAPFDAIAPTHEVLLKAGVVIVESLNLSKIAPGAYTLYCLPIKLAGADGAPARVVLIASEPEKVK
ncbi:MAG: Kynurenine formamidase [Chlamydiales bacterium]|nr:Kynurenine formamidase [Chlamydiales bacterium]